ncbi:hypothetical protein MMC13_001070 [Lambiella insularis]|nr:hypothetical protein [Lambiella insularis]
MPSAVLAAKSPSTCPSLPPPPQLLTNIHPPRPNFTITLLRTPHLPPTMASFLVPLNLNKLDLKDYLYHVYNVPVLSVRSFIQQQRVRQDKPDAKLPKSRRWYRPRSVKKMTVEMGVADLGEGATGGPFVWPEEEKDLEAWDKTAWDAAQKTQEAENEKFGPKKGQLPRGDRQTMAEQAKALLEGKMIWRPSWRDYGRAVEVERDVDVDLGRRSLPSIVGSAGEAAQPAPAS